MIASGFQRPYFRRGTVLSHVPLQKHRGTVRDFSGRGANASLQSAVTSVSQKRGGALGFNGATYASVAAGKAPSSLTEMTIMAWFSTTSTGFQTIVDCADATGRNYGIRVNGFKVFPIFDLTNIGTSSNATLASGIYYHVAVVRNGSAGSWTYKTYINGVLDNSQTTSFNFSSGTFPFYYGMSGSTLTSFLTGNAWGVKVQGVALSGAEILQAYKDSLIDRSRIPSGIFTVRRSLFKPWFMFGNQ